MLKFFFSSPCLEFPQHSLIHFNPFLQPRGGERPKEDRIDHLKGEEFDKAYTYQQTSRRDGADVSHQHVTSEEITVSRRDLNRMEETDKPRYPKDLDIGRIVIDEISEEKGDMMKPDVVKRDEIQRSRRDDIDTRYEVSKKQVKQDLVKVGRLDIMDYEKTSRGSDQEKTTTHTETLGKDRKVRVCFLEMKWKLPNILRDLQS
jgi:hypothetical protein